MPDFDVQQVVESAARAMFKRTTGGDWNQLLDSVKETWHFEARAALAVIVPAVTEQIRATHHEVHDCNYDECLRINGDCLFVDQCSCGQQPCEEARLLDELDAAARGEQP